MFHDPILANIPLIPTPKKVRIYDDTITLANLSIHTNHCPWKKHISIFQDYFRRINDTVPIESCGGIELYFDSSIKASGYVFDSTNGIRISASDEEGILYGLATALQLIKVENSRLSAPKFHIEDYPDKEYRGLMVDLARLWHPMHTIFRYIDICFYFKVKYLHLHFIDDQIYSLPSKHFPNISTKGKSYTFEEIETVRKYAAERNIILVPEVEVPGHARSLISAYPEVFGNNFTADCNTTIITESGSVIDRGNIICAGNPKAMEGVTALIKEVIEMFPESPYIHIGGDEANIKAWNMCADCVQYMKNNNIEDEYELYSDFIGRVAQVVLDNGKVPIVWEGFPVKGTERVPKETIVIAWESHYHMVYDLLKEGFKVINCSWQPLYIVPNTKLRWNPSDILAWNVYNWQHWWPNSEARLNPINVAPTDAVLGGQLCSWECSYEQEVNFIMENLAAVSERTWTVRRECDDAEFQKKLGAILHKLALILIE